MSLHRSPYARALLLAALFAGVLPVMGVALAAPQPSDPAPAARDYLSFTNEPVSVVATQTAAPANGELDYTAVVRLDEPTDYLQVRIQLRRPSGRLIYQKTQVEKDVGAGVRSFRFTRALEDLGLRPGPYPVEISVVADGEPIREWSAETTLRLYDPEAEPLPVALIVRVESAPMTDPEGRFVVDPAAETSARDGVRAVAEAVLSDTDLRATLGIAPLVLQEWRRVTQGYEVAGAAGVTAVGPESPVAASYGATLDTLKQALATGRLELIDVPYADPDLAGLQGSGRARDLGAQLARGAGVYAATIDATPSAGLAAAENALAKDFASTVSKRGKRYAVVAAGNLRRGDATPTVGVYDSDRLPFTVLVPEASLVESATAVDAGALLDSLFDRSIARRRPAAVPAVLTIGPASGHSADSVVDALTQSADSPWLDAVTAREAAAAATSASIELVERLPADGDAPADFWPTVAEARRYATAYASAAPQADPDAASAATDSLIAECAWWAGPDGTWSLADRAFAFTASALRRSKTTFDRISVTGENVTLSGTSGSVPFSVKNGDERPLTVRIKAAGPAVAVPYSSRLTLAPGETYLSIPVELRRGSEGQVALQVVSADVTIATRAVSVSASYLDRLAILGAIVLVLVGMLVYISRRVRRADNTDNAR